MHIMSNENKLVRPDSTWYLCIHMRLEHYGSVSKVDAYKNMLSFRYATAYEWNQIPLKLNQVKSFALICSRTFKPSLQNIKNNKIPNTSIC